ncbi:MAG: hypothetical protein SFZ24_02490 [Planctomycetota bacterium]|nr:hypothetical protein [Planctomycetota bacterium]
MVDRVFQPDPNHMSARPRRVRGGVRIAAKSFPPQHKWVGTRWMQAVGLCAREAELREGFDYAKSGQTRTLTVEPGRVVASVQGRAVRGYKVVVQVQPFTDEEWTGVVGAMAEQAVFSARLLAGELPEEAEALFASRGLALFPRGPQDMVAACTAPNERPWCKHACCVALLVADALERDPFVILALRGMPAPELIERLRDRRSASSGGLSASPAGVDIGVERADDSPPLETVLEEFWDAGPGLEEVETPIRPPEVPLALLRRLGPSPFPESRFPLVGLLATCYETMSRAAVEDEGPATGARSDGEPDA